MGHERTRRYPQAVAHQSRRMAGRGDSRLTPMTDTQFIPRYEGHEPPRHFAEIRRQEPVSKESLPTRPLSVRECRALAARTARSEAVAERRSECQHPGWNRVYGGKCAVRCHSCGLVKEVSGAERKAICPKAPGQPPARHWVHGELLSVYEMSAKYGPDWRTIYGRIAAGWTMEMAVSPTGRRKVA